MFEECNGDPIENGDMRFATMANDEKFTDYYVSAICSPGFDDSDDETRVYLISEIRKLDTSRRRAIEYRKP